VVARVSHTTVDCHDAFALSQWWKEVLGYTDVPDDPNEAGDEECLIVDPDGAHRILFVEVPGTHEGKNPVHLDLVSRDADRDTELARLLALGARVLADHRGIRGPGTGWVTLADPEGNEFCIVRT
jgi:catechol 2,3-dioxygenase-like lactoylglutathione lyase family enzyme